jgi:hypothetical protein
VGNSPARLYFDTQVYFDTAAFAAAKGKTYGKLDPSKVAAGQAAAQPGAADWAEGKTSAELLAEGEGALTAADAEKRSSAGARSRFT